MEVYPLGLVINDSSRLAGRALDPFGIEDAHMGGDADGVLDDVFETGRSREAGIRRRLGTCFNPDLHLVHPPLSCEDDLEVWGELADREDDLLDPGRKHAHPAKNYHIVGPTGDFFRAAHGSGRAGKLPCQVAGPIAEDRHRLFRQRGEYEFTFLAVGQDLPCRRIDHLGIEVIPPDMNPVLGLDAFARTPRPHDLRKAIDIDGVKIEGLCDVGAGARSHPCSPFALLAHSGPRVPARHPIFAPSWLGEGEAMKQCSDEASLEYLKLCLVYETCIASGGADFLTCASATERSAQALRPQKKPASKRGRVADCYADGSLEEYCVYSLDLRSARALLSRSEVIGRKYPQCRGHRRECHSLVGRRSREQRLASGSEDRIRQRRLGFAHRPRKHERTHHLAVEGDGLFARGLLAKVRSLLGNHCGESIEHLV
jgi:hypothetical protein